MAPVQGIENLSRAIDAVLQDTLLQKIIVGFEAVNLYNDDTLYSTNNATLFRPASNMKLLTSAAALHYLQPDFRFKTQMAIDSGGVVSDTLRGNIYLIGSGDPSFSVASLITMILELQSKGINHIDGDIICDDSAMDDVQYGSGWMWDDQPYAFAAPVSALTIGGNTITAYATPSADSGKAAEIRLDPETEYVEILNSSTTVDSTTYRQLQADTLSAFQTLKITRRWKSPQNLLEISGYTFTGQAEKSTQVSILQPSLYFGQLFKEYADRLNLTISGSIRRDVTPLNAGVIVSHFSDALPLLVTTMNKVSDNLYAELLLKKIGAIKYGEPGTAENGIRAIFDLYERWGGDTERIRISDGSGASHYNLLSLDHIILLLAQMHADPTLRNEFIASLPIMGIDGTLEKRLRESIASKVTRAKTGHISAVSNLSGYTTNRNGDTIAFSILMNNFVGSSRPYRELQHKLCELLVRYQRMKRE